MKLVQNINDRRHFAGVEFPRGVPIELPPGFPMDSVRHLIAWGWTVVDEEPCDTPVETTTVDEDDEVTSEQEESLPARVHGRGRRK